MLTSTLTLPPRQETDTRRRPSPNPSHGEGKRFRETPNSLISHLTSPILSLEKPQRIRHSQSATHLRRKLLNERKVVSIKPVRQIKRIERNNVRRMSPCD